MYAERNIEERTCNHSCSEKSISITYFEGAFVALGIEVAMRMRHIVLWGVPGCTLFSTLSHKRHDFRYTFVYMCCGISRNLFEKYFSF
jgi:predicted transcriptional regulator